MPLALTPCSLHRDWSSLLYAPGGRRQVTGGEPTTTEVWWEDEVGNWGAPQSTITRQHHRHMEAGRVVGRRKDDGEELGCDRTGAKGVVHDRCTPRGASCEVQQRSVNKGSRVPKKMKAPSHPDLKHVPKTHVPNGITATFSTTSASRCAHRDSASRSTPARDIAEALDTPFFSTFSKFRGRYIGSPNPFQ